jgi:hypothetical protein
MTDNQPKLWGVYLQSMVDRHGHYAIYKTSDGREVNVTMVSDDKSFSFYTELKKRAQKEHERFEPFEVTDWVKNVQLVMPRPNALELEPIKVAKLAYKNAHDAEFEAEMKK